MTKTISSVIAAILISAIAAHAQVGPGPIPSVQGPASATSGHLATFNGTSGKIIQDGGAAPVSAPCSAFGTTAGTCAQGGVISAGGPTGGATTVPIITYNAAGQLTTVSSAATGVTTNGTAAVGQLPGTTTNDDAASGKVGEYIHAEVLSGSAISLTNATAANLTSITLTAGDWDFWGSTEITFSVSGTLAIGGINTVSTTLPDPSLRFMENTTTSVLSQEVGAIPTQRISLSAPATLYLVVRGDFAAGTGTAAGFVSARRAR